MIINLFNMIPLNWIETKSTIEASNIFKYEIMKNKSQNKHNIYIENSIMMSFETIELAKKCAAEIEDKIISGKKYVLGK